MSNYSHSICCMGDSLTHNYTLGVHLNLLYPSRLQDKLRDNDAKVVVRNFGRSGNTTQQMIDRFSAMTQFGVPDIGVIFGGVNDPGNAVAQATTQANLQNMIQQLKATGTQKIIVVTAQFLNYTTGGDFDGSDNPKTDTTSFYASVIAAQKAAASAESVVLCDLFNFLRNRIINGQDVKHSASWHVDVANQHFNAYGCDLVADCVLQTIQAQKWDKQLI